jgi:hypothetical protein
MMECGDVGQEKFEIGKVMESREEGGRRPKPSESLSDFLARNYLPI